MSVNAINGLSIYEFYFIKNKKTSTQEDSPVALELKKYGIKATSDEDLNAQLLKQAVAKSVVDNDSSGDNSEKTSTDYSSRPWAEIMYMLNLSFNEDPQDDITDIKRELDKLTLGMSDDNIKQEVKYLKNHVEELYNDYDNLNTSFDTSTVSLTNTAALNRAIMI